MKIKRLILTMIRRIGFVNLCPECFNKNTELISITESMHGIEYKRICNSCNIKYIVVHEY